MPALVKLFGAVALSLIGIWIAVRIWSVFFRRVVVWEYEKGLRFDNGRFTGIVESGCYYVLRLRTRIDCVDTRIAHTVLTGQEVLSSDSVSIKMSLIAKYEVTDPVVAVTKCRDYGQSLHSLLQIALREIVGSRPIDGLLEGRASFDAELKSRCEQEAAELGLNLLGVNVRDIMFPGELKRVFAQVVEARKQGLAALERARGETAALRNLANAAKLLETQPGLLQLRVLQTLGESSGNSVVLGLSTKDGIVPIVPVASGTAESG